MNQTKLHNNNNNKTQIKFHQINKIKNIYYINNNNNKKIYKIMN